MTEMSKITAGADRVSINTPAGFAATPDSAGFKWIESGLLQKVYAGITIGCQVEREIGEIVQGTRSDLHARHHSLGRATDEYYRFVKIDRALSGLFLDIPERFRHNPPGSEPVPSRHGPYIR